MNDDTLGCGVTFDDGYDIWTCNSHEVEGFHADVDTEAHGGMLARWKMNPTPEDLINAAYDKGFEAGFRAGHELGYDEGEDDGIQKERRRHE